MRYRILLSVLIGLSMTACDRSNNSEGGSYGEQLGTVAIPLDCSDEANSQVERGTALLHHMTYQGARQAFARASENDPECAIAYWGEAMTFIHPLWSDPPGEEAFSRGAELLDKARNAGNTGERVSAYISATAAYYDAGRNQTEAPNLEAFANGWEEVYRQFPDDPEAAAFRALSLLATADPKDKSYAVQKRSGAIAAEILDEIPDHPGAHHYVIHSYDYPALAEMALETARSYGKIAPAVPHALHMPSHIFTRLGLWDESIEMNRRSADAALNHPAGNTISAHYLHALDYLAYAHLQKGDDRQARNVLEKLENLDGPVQPHVGSSYTLAAIPARIALERHRWEEAADLEPRTPANFPWDKYPAMEAISHFAVAVGAARTGQTEKAKAALDRLASLQEKTAAASEYWATQIEVQHTSAKAWLAFEEGRHDEALSTMETAAELESSTEKHPVTPGEVLPAREQLADMLVEMERYNRALSEYEKALERNPNRFNSLYGAAHAAERAGKMSEADTYYSKLVEVAGEAGVNRSGIQHAKTFLTRNRAGM